MKIKVKDVFAAMINTVITGISFLVPKSSKMVICGGWFGKRFADNSKAMYLYLFQNKEKLGIEKVFYVTDNPEIQGILNTYGYTVLKKKSLKSIWYHLRSKYHIVDQGPNDLFKFFSVRSIRVNLWHGFPLKKIGYITKLNTPEINALKAYNSKKSGSTIGGWNKQYLLALSDSHKKHMGNAFAIPNDMIIKGYYPRVAYMLEEIHHIYFGSEQINVDKITGAKGTGKKIVFYLPTFRDRSENNDKLIDTINSLDLFLKENNICLVTKMHFAANTSGIEVKKSQNIINLPPEADVYNFLAYSDIMITDYSSVYFDFMLLDRPIIYYPFDIDYYEKSDRGFLYNYEAFTNGVKAYNLEELKNGVIFGLNSPLEYQEKFKAKTVQILKTVYGNEENSMEKLIADILSL